MAVIFEYVHPTIGCTISVHDDCIRGVTEEEMQNRRRELDRTVAKILSNPERREALRRLNREKYGDEE